MTIYATIAPLHSLTGFVEIAPLAVVPVTGDLICINDLVANKRGIFRVRERMVSIDHVRLWLHFVED